MKQSYLVGIIFSLVLIGCIALSGAAIDVTAQQNPYDVDETQTQVILDTPDREGTVRIKNIQFNHKVGGPGQLNRMKFTADNTSEEPITLDLNGNIQPYDPSSFSQNPAIVSPGSGAFSTGQVLKPGEQRHFEMFFTGGKPNPDATSDDSKKISVEIADGTTGTVVQHDLATTTTDGTSVGASISPTGERQEITTSVDSYKDDIDDADRPNYNGGIPPVDPDTKVDTAVGQIYNFEDMLSNDGSAGRVYPRGDQLQVGFEMNNLPTNEYYTVQLRYSLYHQDYNTYAEARFVRADGSEIDPDTTYYIGNSETTEVQTENRTRYFQLSPEEAEYATKQGRIYMVLHHPEEKHDSSGNYIEPEDRDPISLVTGNPTTTGTEFKDSQINIQFFQLLSSENPLNFSESQLNIQDMEITDSSGSSVTDFDRGEQVQIHFDVMNNGNDVLNEYVYLLENGRNIRQKQVNLNPGEQQRVTFYINRYISGNYEYSATAFDESNTISIDSDKGIPPEGRIEAENGIKTVNSVYHVERTGDSFEFSAADSTAPDGSIVSYNWQLKNSSGVVASQSGTQFSTSINNSGTYELELEVTDNTGQSSYSTASVSIGTLPPTAVAGDDISITPGESVLFNGSASYHEFSNINITSYEWDFGDGTTQSGETATHSYSDEGEYTVELTVRDENGNESVDTRTVTVEGQDPVASFEYTPEKPIVGTTNVEFDASESYDPDGVGLRSYEWDFGDGTTREGPIVEKMYAESGTYTVELTVENVSGTDTITQQITVQDELFNPKISGPDQVGLNTVNGYDSFNTEDPDSNVEQIEWDMGDGTTYSGDELVNHRYDQAGTYTVTLTMNGGGFTAQDTMNVTVDSTPPEAVAQYSDTIYLSDKINFFGEDSYHPDDLSIEEYEWDLDNGDTKTGRNILEYRFTEPTQNYEENPDIIRSTYEPTLKVTDEAGAYSTESVEVDVINRGPVADYTISGTSGNSGTADTDYNVNSGDVFEGDASASYHKEAPYETANIEWDMGDGTTYTSEQISHQWSESGVYEVTLTASDRWGATDTKTFDVEVNRRKPTAKIDADPEIVSGYDSKVQFDASGTEAPDSTIQSYEWHFGDGESTTTSSPTVSHEYPFDGNYTVTVTVVDNYNEQDTASTVVVKKNSGEFYVGSTIKYDDFENGLNNWAGQGYEWPGWGYGGPYDPLTRSGDRLRIRGQDPTGYSLVNPTDVDRNVNNWQFETRFSANTGRSHHQDRDIGGFGARHEARNMNSRVSPNQGIWFEDYGNTISFQTTDSNGNRLVHYENFDISSYPSVGNINNHKWNMKVQSSKAENTLLVKIWPSTVSEPDNWTFEYRDRYIDGRPGYYIVAEFHAERYAWYDYYDLKNLVAGGSKQPEEFFSSDNSGDTGNWTEVSPQNGGSVNISDNELQVIADAEGNYIYSDDVSSASRYIRTENQIDVSDVDTLFVEYEYEASRRDDGVGNNETGYMEVFWNGNSVKQSIVYQGDKHDAGGNVNKRTAHREGIIQVDVSNTNSGHLKIHSRAHSSNSGYTDVRIKEVWGSG